MIAQADLIPQTCNRVDKTTEQNVKPIVCGNLVLFTYTIFNNKKRTHIYTCNDKFDILQNVIKNLYN